MDGPLVGHVRIRYIQPHKIQTQDPDVQRLMMSSKDGVGQVIKACGAVVARIALTGRFRVIKAPLNDVCGLTRGTRNAVGPAQRTNRLITLDSVDETLDVDLHGLDSGEGSWHGMASVYTILTCHDPGIQEERASKFFFLGAVLAVAGLVTGCLTPLGKLWYYVSSSPR